MEKFIYVVWNNIIGNNKECVYVRATEKEIGKREFYNGFRHFNRDCYAYSKEFPYGTKIDGQQILSIRKFDKWLEKNILN